MALATRSPVCESTGQEFKLSDWLEAGRALLQTWLDVEFRWGERALGRFVGRVEVEFPDNLGSAVVYDNPDPLPITKLSEGSTDLAFAVYDDPFHRLWHKVIEGWQLQGTWLHPDSCFDIDSIAWQGGMAVLPIGCLDREDPKAPRRYDPTVAAWCHDIGVVDFPLHAQRYVPEAIGAGVQAGDIAMLVASRCVAEAAVHEALELFQKEPGVPLFDAHHRTKRVKVCVSWRDTTGNEYGQVGWA